jgi:prepilin-type processing-associated H-X9-DG protein
MGIYYSDSNVWGMLYYLKYIKDRQVTRCNADRVTNAGMAHNFYVFGPENSQIHEYGQCSYAYNAYGLGGGYGWSGFQGTGPPGFIYHPSGSWYEFVGFKLTQVKQPAATYWMMDGSDAPNHTAASWFYGWGDPVGAPPKRHATGINMLWLDGHVTWIDGKEACDHDFYAFSKFTATTLPEKWWDVPDRPGFY